MLFNNFNDSKIKSIAILPYKNLGQILLVLTRIAHLLAINVAQNSKFKFCIG
jgi:hypothetical protein